MAFSFPLTFYCVRWTDNYFWGDENTQCMSRSFYAWGAYTAAFFIGKFSDMGMPDALGFLIILAAAIVVGVVLGFVIEQGILKYMYHRDEVLIVLATFGLFLVLEDIILLAFGTDPYFAYQPMALLDAVEMGELSGMFMD